ncbi:hypothetical protein JI752_002185 [Lysobacter sp. MMG2]|nr:hypothetical protein [Lysobacter sp. MMG2]
MRNDTPAIGRATHRRAMTSPSRPDNRLSTHDRRPIVAGLDVIVADGACAVRQLQKEQVE